MTTKERFLRAFRTKRQIGCQSPIPVERHARALAAGRHARKRGLARVLLQRIRWKPSVWIFPRAIPEKILEETDRYVISTSLGA